MAEEKETTRAETEAEQTPEQPQTETPSSGSGPMLYTWLILGAVTLAGSGGGFALSHLMGGTTPTDLEIVNEAANQENAINAMLTKQTDQRVWIEEFEPVLANLDEPGVTRYVRLTITLEMSPELDEIKGREFMAVKKMLVRDWMTTYLAGLSLEDVRGSRNLNQIKKDVLQQCNELLFPKGQPFVKRVFFKEFAVQ
ncbi:MAG: flagellar basal body-associated FliL family protein [Phycisphaerae bacterium]|nr:flagellar basal body-associated FliL family protein [Phycisphaerae bacterium]